MSCKTPSSSSKPAKTILDFFKPNSNGEEPKSNVASVLHIRKISCPACNETVSEARINWHLDQDCSSRVIKKKRKRSKKAPKISRKKPKASGSSSQANAEKKARAVLSDSDIELCEEISDGSESPALYDMPNYTSENVSPNSSQNGVYFSTSMLETQLLESDENKPSTSFSEVKVKSNSALQTEKMLVNDWLEDDNSVTCESNVEYINTEEFSVFQNTEKEKKIITNDYEKSLNCDPYYLTSVTMEKENDPIINVADTQNDHDTPKKANRLLSNDLRPLSQMSEVLKWKNRGYFSNPSEIVRSNAKNESSNCDTSMVASSSVSSLKAGRRTFSLSYDPLLHETKRINNVEKTQNISFDFDICTEELKLPALDEENEDDSNSSGLYSPLGSPGLVSPLRTPSPSPCKNKSRDASVESSSLNDNITSNAAQTSSVNSVLKDASKKLMQTPVKFDSVSKSPTKSAIEMLHERHIKLSPSLKHNKSRFGLAQKSPKKLSPLKKSLSSPNAKSNKITNNVSRSINDTMREEEHCINFSPAKSVDLTEQNHSPSKQNSSQPTSNNFPSKSPKKSPGKTKTPQDFREHTGYYLDNFQTILDAVCSCPADYKLFNEEDKNILSSFKSLSLAAKKLFVRLFQRKAEWKRVSKIEYQDICDTEDIILYVKELSYAKYLLIENELDSADEALAMLSGEEVTSLAKKMKVNVTGKSKTDLINTLLNNCKVQPTIAAAFSGTSSSAHATELLLSRAKAILGPCCLVPVGVRRVLLRVFTLYSLPRYDEDDDSGQSHQLVTLLRVNLGQVKYPSNTVRIRHYDIFTSREDLIQFEECQELYSAVKEHLENRCWQEAVDLTDRVDVLYQRLSSLPAVIDHDHELPRFLRRYTSLSLLVHLKAHRVEALQRLKKYSSAVKVLRELLAQNTHHQDCRGAWYDRLALNLDQHLKMHAKALEVVYEALRDPEVRVGHRLALSLRGQRLLAFFSRQSVKAKKKRKSGSENDGSVTPSDGGVESLCTVPSGIKFMDPLEAPRVVIEGRSFEMENSSGFRRVFLRGDSAVHSGEGDVMACSVEELALGHYSSQGYSQGLHGEGTTVNSIFGFLFWRIIYESEVPDAFRLVHQAVPLDLDYPNFYLARKQSIDDRVAEVANMTDAAVLEAVSQVWQEHEGETCIIHWDLFKSEQHVTDLILSLDVRVVSKICERLATDHRFTRSGFPDLIVWNPAEKKSRVVEVKGPNDRLSTKQILWLEYLMRCGAVAEVCHVEAIGAKMMQTKTARVLTPSKKRKDGRRLDTKAGNASGRPRAGRRKAPSPPITDDDFC